MNALRGNPENQDLLQALAQVRMRKQDWAGTGETLKNLDGLGTASAVNHLLSAQMYQGLEDQTLAIVEFEKALELNPGLNPALQGLVAAHMQLEQKDAVVNYLQQHISEHPELINGYAALASVYRETGDSEQALETLEQGISQHPNWIESYRFIAISMHARIILKKSLRLSNADWMQIRKIIYSPCNWPQVMRRQVILSWQDNYTKM